MYLNPVSPFSAMRMAVIPSALATNSAVLASPDYLSPRTLSVTRLLRALGPGAVLAAVFVCPYFEAARR